MENPEEITHRTLNHYALLAFKEAYWALNSAQRANFQREWLAGLRAAAVRTDIFQSTESGADLLVWSAASADEKQSAAVFFEKFAAAMSPFRALLDVKDTLWGFTRPSQYSKARSKQEIDPFAETRQPYLVIYPFSKTIEWYLMSREARQGMMNEHIRIGKQYDDISQLLLYSFGLQNQEFVVVYETDDLPRFSDLVNELRDTEGRRYTLRDTPVHTAIYRPAEETLALWKMNNRFLRAAGRLPVDATPVWFMRQAGRYMPEYRAIREHYSLLEICYHPELAAEVTLQPVRALGVDAAILFADILLPAIPLGVGLEFAKHEGPILGRPVRNMEDVLNLRPVNPETDLGYVLEAIKLVRAELKDIPLIGFCGAPFTVAAYLVEGGSSRDFLKTKQLMYSDPLAWHALMAKLAVVLSDYLLAQIRAGAQAVQVFDSWVGALSPADYENYVLPYSQKVLQSAETSGVPVIHFGTNTTTLLPAMKRAGGSVLGLDWRLPLDDGWKLIGYERAVQGNLDPALLFAPLPTLKAAVQDILRRADGRPGRIFNLGHGILQNTPVENVRAVVEMVHEYAHVPSAADGQA